LSTVLAVVAIAFLGITVGGSVSGAPLVVACATLVLAALGSGYCGWLSWYGDHPFRRLGGRKEILHKAERVHFIAELCQILGLVGAATGFYLIAQTATTGDAQSAVHRIIEGLGKGIIATLTGILCSLVLLVQHHVLTHKLER
jgi:hypothetical protein